MPSKVRKITVDATERKLLKERRETLGLTQRQLAKMVGATNGTISNLENGKHPQIKQSTYMRLRYVLLRDRTQPEDSSDDIVKDISDGIPDLDRHALNAVKNLVESLKKPK